jgi:small-conductance mechanosensitive channel
MEIWEAFLKTNFWGNAGNEILLALGVFVGVLIVLKIFKTIVIKKLQKLAVKTKNDFDDKVIEIVSNVKPPLYFLAALYVAVKYLTLNEIAWQIIQVVFVIVVFYEVIKAAQDVVEYAALKAMNKNEKEEEENKASIRTLSVIIKIVLWSVGIILVLSNLGIDVSSLIAGLGIGGIAVALAMQNILGDIFSSFSIIIDKPFKVGDFIKVGEDTGTVEKIGIKTTRLRTLLGEELVISNNELTSARVQNFKKMEKRRVAFDLGVIYETKKELLEKIPDLVKTEIEKVKGVEFDRCHFKSFGDFSLNFETVYYVNSADYTEYMNINQKVNINIFETFNKQKIEFAYPTHLEYQKKA